MVVEELVGLVVELVDDVPSVGVVGVVGVVDDVVTTELDVDDDTGGTIVSSGGTVLTGFEVLVVSPDAERVVEPPPQEATTSPTATTTATIPGPERARGRRPRMGRERSCFVNIVDTATTAHTRSVR